jgi:hypothetical protein
VSTLLVAFLAIAWYVPVSLISENFLYDSLAALSLMIAFYYALSGIACAVYYRHHLLRSVQNLVLIGIAPVLGAAILGYLFVKSAIDLSEPADSSTGESIFGIGVPLAIAIFFLAVGVVLMIVWALGGHQRFFGRRLEALPAGIDPKNAPLPDDVIRDDAEAIAATADAKESA